MNPRLELSRTGCIGVNGVQAPKRWVVNNDNPLRKRMKGDAEPLYIHKYRSNRHELVTLIILSSGWPLVCVEFLSVYLVPMSQNTLALPTLARHKWYLQQAIRVYTVLIYLNEHSARTSL